MNLNQNLRYGQREVQRLFNDKIVELFVVVTIGMLLESTLELNLKVMKK